MRVIYLVALITFLLAFVGCGSEGESAADQIDRPDPLPSPFVGESRATFEATLATARSKEVSHTFRLRNSANQVVEILKIGTTCGCTVGEASSKTVAPGEQVEIDATLAISGPGKKKELIKLVLDVGVVHALVMEANVTIAADVQPTCGAVRLDKASRIVLPILGITNDVTRPPSTPVIDTPDGVTYAFTGWRPRFPLVETDDLDAGLWLGEIELERRPDWRVPPDAALRIEFDGWKEMQVGLAGRPAWLPWKRPEPTDTSAVRAGSS